MKQIFLILLCLGLINQAFSQRSTTFSGKVVDAEQQVLIGATVNWQNTTVGAVTDADGWFTIPRLDTLEAHLLEINYVGYETTAVEILPEEENLQLIIEATATLADITVERRQRASFSSTLNPINLETIGEGELRRAACCNLSESFENNATVNVNFTDAITGAKEIEMLGLRGTYTQLLVDNKPTFNRLGRAYGLEYIPGTFIKQIQISKGASSVKTGVQGITGQINTAMIRPFDAPLLFVNLFGNSTGRMELNTQFNYRLTKEWSTGLLVHANYFQTPWDNNKDGFLDIPLKKQLNVVSRWTYKPENFHTEINIHGILDERQGGQTAALYETLWGQPADRLYEVNTSVRRLGVSGKVGYFGFNNPEQSIAFLYDANIHEHRSIFGNRRYDASQRRVYATGIFQTNLMNNLHHLNAGLTYEWVDFKEQFTDVNSDRTEQIAAAHAEYDFTKTFNETKGSALSIILGLRTDLINIARATDPITQVYVSPRLNVKYNFTENLVLRASAGRGVRTPNALIENLKYMPSYRSFVMLEQINPEVAWNYGLNLVWNFEMDRVRSGQFSIDLYRTDFENQLVVDIDSDPTYNTVQFYNLKGQSFANSLLVAYTQDIIKGLEVRLAYKYNQVQMTFGNVLHDVPLMPQHRGLLHLNYTTPKKDWEFNATLNIIARQRLPHLHPPYGDNLPDYRLANEYAPTYATLNAHISKQFKGGWEVYIGGENLTNYTQEQPILGFEDPYGTGNGNTARFDASAVYAPVFGARIYAGVKYTFQGKERFPAATCGNSVVDNTHEGHDHEGHDHEGHDHETATINVSAQCGMCATKIKTAVQQIVGVENIQVDVAQQTVKVDYNVEETDLNAIRNAILALGYDADHLKGNAEAYKTLPACCKKP